MTLREAVNTTDKGCLEDPISWEIGLTGRQGIFIFSSTGIVCACLITDL